MRYLCYFMWLLIRLLSYIGDIMYSYTFFSLALVNFSGQDRGCIPIYLLSISSFLNLSLTSLYLVLFYSAFLRLFCPRIRFFIYNMFHLRSLLSVLLYNSVFEFGAVLQMKELIDGIFSRK